MKTDQVRKSFLDFFKSKKHKILPSSPLIPEDDPTLLFTSAGMNQFKRQFKGLDIKYSKVATAQKCLRTGDLEKVGKTPFHHTFFEMLGNFSFGDYFKREAISLAWEYLTEILNIENNRLWVSVYKDDQEAFDIWKDIVPQSRIIKKGDKENFWPQEAITKGPNGPCGPCSEIFYDQGEDVGCLKDDCQPGCSCGRFVEIWNLVFTQMTRKGPLGKKGKLTALPNKNIDTGMGLERMAQVMQGVDSNFKIDIFTPLIDFLIENTDADYKKEADIFKVNAICDHIRAATFAIAEGIIPSNEERGYVIRKLIRRSKHMLSELGVELPYLYKMVPIVADVMKRPYPEITKRQENIAQVILEEEKKFEEVLKQAPQLKEEKMHKQINVYKKSPKKLKEDGFSSLSAFTGSIAANIYDTYGIPEDLTKKWADDLLKDKFKDRDFEKVFKKQMENQKKRSKESSRIKEEIFSESRQDLLSGIKKTDFTGYDKLESKAKIVTIIKDEKKAKSLQIGEEGLIILNSTPFYAEAGGQVADAGIIESKTGKAKVKNAESLGGIYVHQVKIESGSFKQRDSVKAIVDKQRRKAIACNHTSTHLLQYALRKVLGPHVEQSGSLVNDKKLRFDFTHFKQITDEQLARVEEIVNECIQNNDHIKKEIMELKDAKRQNALAFFKEKYSNRVRVISIGNYSKELCGGTHIDSTGQIGLFKIVHESSIASGIRRIEAVTAKQALDYMNNQQEMLDEIKQLLKSDSKNLVDNVKKIIKENKSLKKEIDSLKINISKIELQEALDEAKIIKGTKITIHKFDKVDMDNLRKLNDMIKQKVDSCINILASVIENKAIVIVGLSDDLIHKGLNANKIIQKINQHLQSKGGGRSDLAQAGSGDPSKLKAAFDKIYNYLEKRMNEDTA